MGLEFQINEELANIAITSTELYAASKNIISFVRNDSFKQQFGQIFTEINQAYCVIDNSFSPFCRLHDEESFVANFDALFANFSENYLMEISKPRKYFDNVYEDFIELQQSKEAKSKFPLLKHHYSRFAGLYDKHIDNDAYLAMSIDRVIKLQNQLLNEISNLKAKDPEDAFLLLHAACEDFADYLQIIRVNRERIDALVKNYE